MPRPMFRLSPTKDDLLEALTEYEQERFRSPSRSKG